MLFPTITFAVFFLFVLPLHWITRPFPLQWRFFMLAAGYVFYGAADWKFCFLLAGSTLLNHAFGQAISQSTSQQRQKFFLTIATVCNLGILAWFKYYGFFASSFVNMFNTVGIDLDFSITETLLPIGISFYTFQGMSYVIDIYRGTTRPASLLDFAVYLSFFPQIVAGPVVRASELLPQFGRRPDPRRLDGARAFWLIAAGLAKKLVLADFLATGIVEPVFSTPEAHSAIDVLVGILAYAVQIYCDFSAYTDIAIGLALLLGFKLPENFDAPYTSVSLQDFWRRWHMTLSRWLRDYLYIPLGGSRDGEFMTRRNLFLTMLLGGLWHGAAWNFVIWGAWHGGMLAAERERAMRQTSKQLDTPRQRAQARLRTFVLVCIGWVFFRAESLGSVFALFWRLVTGWTTQTHLVTPGVLLAVAIGIGAQYVRKEKIAYVLRWFSHFPTWAQGAALGVVLLFIDTLAAQGVANFIYFRF